MELTIIEKWFLALSIPLSCFSVAVLAVYMGLESAAVMCVILFSVGASKLFGEEGE